MNDPLGEQSRRNRESRAAWDLFAGHRGQVTALLTAAAQGRRVPRLCLLGAGNCNDVDLHRLLEDYREIHLVDCDSEALAAALERQSLTGHSSLICHGAIDLLRGTPALESYEVVASLCLLSQLVESALEFAPDLAASAAGELDRLQAVRRQHLEALVTLTAPGGMVLLITDVVSSETAPQLLPASEKLLPALVAQCIQQRNFFSGTNPAPILDLLQRDPWFAERIESPEPIGPWKWDFGPRSYAVYAIRFRRRAES